MAEKLPNCPYCGHVLSYRLYQLKNSTHPYECIPCGRERKTNIVWSKKGVTTHPNTIKIAYKSTQIQNDALGLAEMLNNLIVKT